MPWHPVTSCRSVYSVPAGDLRFRIWDSYWQDSRLYSSGVEADLQIAAAFEDAWQTVTRNLFPGARVLDIGCGNGAAAFEMARAAKTMGGQLSIVGIDSAAIDPQRYVGAHTEILSTIEFRPLVNMEVLP